MGMLRLGIFSVRFLYRSVISCTLQPEITGHVLEMISGLFLEPNPPPPHFFVIRTLARYRKYTVEKLFVTF